MNIALSRTLFQPQRICLIVLLIIGLLPYPGFSQMPESENVIGKTITIKSEYLEEDREVQVYLPEGYLSSSKKYPVLYVMDGQRYFLNAIAFQQNLTWQEIAPEFIVIGVKTHPRKRRSLFYAESPKFMAFLAHELVAKIDKDYRTLDERIYFGWEMAAGLGLDILANHPSLFNGILMASPTHISTARLDKVDSLLQGALNHDKFIYASLGTVENWSIAPMATLDSLFKKHNQAQVSWTYNLSNSENHYTTPLTTINEGFKLFFNDYAPLRFYTISEFNDFGGIAALKAHYQKRGNRYETSADIHADTKHYLLLQCDKENNFELFTQLVQTFDGKSFIANHYRQPRWFVRFAQFYIENDHLADAIEVLKLGDKKFPDSSMLKNELGNYYKQAGELDQAKKWYREAVSIAKTNEEPELEKYLINLDSIR